MIKLRDSDDFVQIFYDWNWKYLLRLLTLKNIIRLGRIQGIERDTIIFKNGERIPTDGSTLHVDCSVNSTAFAPVKEKVFDGDRINLQMVQIPPACTSAAMIAAIELK